MRGHVAVLMEEEHDEARDSDLSDEIEAGAGAEQPHARVVQRPGDVSELGLATCSATDEGCRDGRSHSAHAREEEEGEAGTAGRREHGKQYTQRSTDRDGRLSDPE